VSNHALAIYHSSRSCFRIEAQCCLAQSAFNSTEHLSISTLGLAHDATAFQRSRSREIPDASSPSKLPKSERPPVHLLRMLPMETMVISPIALPVVGLQLAETTKSVQLDGSALDPFD